MFLLASNSGGEDWDGVTLAYKLNPFPSIQVRHSVGTPLKQGGPLPQAICELYYLLAGFLD